MAIVSSFGAMQALTTRRNQAFWTPTDVGGSISLANATSATYSTIYETQPNVRICVDFIARNIAQLGLHVYRRVSDTDRVRLPNHSLARWLKRPNPSTTRYRLIESLMQDLCIYYNAFLLKIRYRDLDGSQQIGLLRLPPESMSVSGGLLPSVFTWTLEDGTTRDFSPADVVHFSGYSPSNPLIGLSPMETLRQTLSEVYAAVQYRTDFWRNGARFEGIIERPREAAKWDPLQRQQFRDGVNAFRQGGARAGAMLVLEDGMTYKTTSADARKSEYTDGLKLAREICAATYHIPQPMVGILDHATLTNVKEYHKHLYQDTLGPWCVWVEEEFERQLLTESDDQEGVYTEFNIAEKLKGSFEEQAASLQALVGRPLMTVNEGRARLNLPSRDDGDELAVQPGTGDAQIREGTGDDDDDESAATRALVDAQHGELQAQIRALTARSQTTIVNLTTVAPPPEA